MNTQPCTDCGYAIAAHFDKHDGRFFGCPWRPLQGAVSKHPRVSLRRGIRGSRKGHVIVTWCDCVDDAGAVLLWDLETDEQWIGDSRQHTQGTRALKGIELERARERVEGLAGGPVELGMLRRGKG